MNDNFKAGYNGLSNEGEAKYVHPEEFEKDKAEFMSLYNYFKQEGKQKDIRKLALLEFQQGVRSVGEFGLMNIWRNLFNTIF